MTFQTEFPDYPAAELPNMPEGFVDTSWRNDTCPSFHHEAGDLTVFVDYPDEAMREFEGGERFTLHTTANDHTEFLFASDDWQAMQAFIRARLAAGAMLAAMKLRQATDRPFASVADGGLGLAYACENLTPRPASRQEREPMSKPETLDDMFESVAQEQREQARREAADPVYQAKAKAKRDAEQAKHDAGIGVYSAEELAEQEAEEDDEDGEDEQ